MKRSTSEKGIRKIGDRVKEKQNLKPKGNSVEYYGISVAWTNGMNISLQKASDTYQSIFQLTKCSFPPTGYLLGKTRYSHICC